MSRLAVRLDDIRRPRAVVVVAATLFAPSCADDGPVTPVGSSSTSASSVATTAGPGGAGAMGGGGGSGGGGGATPSLLDCSPALGRPPKLNLAPVATGLDRPLLAKAPASDTTRLYIAEQSGKIRIVKGGELLATPFLDLSPLVLGLGEGGLLGLAFHPQFDQNGRFFVHYTSQPSSDSVVAEYHVSVDPDVAEPSAVAVVLAHDQPNNSHFGGTIEFGHDGRLYIAFGDGATFLDEANNGQNTSTWAGKILRIDVSSLPYTIPSGNLSMPGALPEIWDWGLRNPWKISFDACTGDLYIGDVGYVWWEEIDVEPKGKGVRNYGWHLKEGPQCFNPSQDCDPNGVTTAPVIAYPNPGDAAVVAGYVYRGKSLPALHGRFFYADYPTGRVWSFVHVDGRATAQIEHTDELATAGMLITSLGQDALGEIYVVDGGGGAVYMITPD